MPYSRSEPQKADFLKLEEGILELWNKEKTFERSVDLRKGCDKFVFVEGPPTANPTPYTYKGCKMPRAEIKTMRGFYVRRKAGWETHGLPV